ncbi:MAG: short-chain dehydrogenase [Rhizorhabdus sp.]|nr:short-chain dehydrogenase [Rhizorhabdus sp.]
MALTESSLGNATKYGPWAVIAGGSDGTGAEFAREIAAAGINLLLAARRQAPLDTLAGELRGDYGIEVRTLSVDLNLPDAADRMAEATQDLEVGLYVSNAGAESGGHHFLDTPLETMRELVGRNVLTVIAACHHFGRAMRARGRGGIVLMGSGAGMGGQPGVAVYSGVKAFALNLAESLWSELRDAGVDVIGIAAPIMETPSLRRSLGDLQIPGTFAPEDVVRNALRRLPDGPSYIYAFGEPPEESERQTTMRRDRVLAVEHISAAFFGDKGE